MHIHQIDYYFCYICLLINTIDDIFDFFKQSPKEQRSHSLSIKHRQDQEAQKNLDRHYCDSVRDKNKSVSGTKRNDYYRLLGLREYKKYHYFPILGTYNLY